MSDSPLPFDDLAFDILLGMREGMRFARTRQALAGKSRPEKEAAEHAVAEAIAARLRRGPWTIERRSVNGPHPAIRPLEPNTTPLPRQVYGEEEPP